MIYFLGSILAITSIIDFYTKRIPDGITLLGTLIAINWHLYYGDITLCVSGLTTGILTVWLMNQLKLQTVGGGDCKLIGLIGACFGQKVVLFTIIVAWILFQIISLILRKGKSIAYAPFITIAFSGVVVWLNVI